MIPVAAHIELDLPALRHNLNRVRDYAPQSKIVAVIKANAYGHGLLNIAESLESGVDALAVARLDEAIRLRKANINTRILVLQGFSSAEEIALFQIYQLEAVIHTAEQVSLLEAALPGKAINVHLKIDTGMNRLGIAAAQFNSLLAQLQHCKLVEKVTFMTHFANADDQQDPKTTQQLNLFNNTTKQYSGEKSCANSAALITRQDTRQDWVRPGLMLYGVSPLLNKTAAELNLHPVMSLHSRIIAIKPIKKGESVGYGASWVAAKNSIIAIVSIGYGDGYPRHAKENTPVLINQQRFPLVGRVSMDMLSIDLMGNTHIKLGDRVTLWGEGLAIEEIAHNALTIPYTLLCGITQRVQVHKK